MSPSSWGSGSATSPATPGPRPMPWRRALTSPSSSCPARATITTPPPPGLCCGTGWRPGPATWFRPCAPSGSTPARLCPDGSGDALDEEPALDAVVGRVGDVRGNETAGEIAAKGRERVPHEVWVVGRLAHGAVEQRLP